MIFRDYDLGLRSANGNKVSLCFRSFQWTELGNVCFFAKIKYTVTLPIQVQGYRVFTNIINCTSVSPSLPLKIPVFDIISTSLLLLYPILNMQQAQDNNCNITINNIVVVYRVKLLCFEITRHSSLSCFVTNWIQKFLCFIFIFRAIYTFSTMFYNDIPYFTWL